MAGGRSALLERTGRPHDDGVRSDRVRASVLLVEAEEDLRADLSRWLTDAGFGVATCAGPHIAQPTCPFDRAGPCELVRSADVVVLDEWLESDTLMTGTPSWELAVAYHAMGKALVVLAGQGDPLRFEQDPSVIVLERPPERAALVRAVEAAASAAVGAPEDWVLDARPGAPRGRPRP
jgi:hypothetical protein